MVSPDPVSSACCDDAFPLAARYPGQARLSRRVREEGGRYRGFAYTERHLQCVWFDARLRPPVLHTREGEVVEVEDPGVWNLEAGPDFLGAVWRVGPERRRLSGDVEIHVDPRDWHRHGHHQDARYRRVRLHVTYFPGPAAPEGLPEGALQVALREALLARPEFSFENIEVAAYPLAARAVRPPCQQVLQAWEAPRKQLVLDAAGQERLRRKAGRLRQRWDEVGPDQALYEEVMAGLGYQHNKAMFRRLAETVSVEALRPLRGRPLEVQARLLGVSSLLPEQPDRRWDEETRRHVRELWDAWWKVREAWQHRLLDPACWHLQGRPANHPLRRLAAAARLFARTPDLADRWGREKPSPAILARLEADLCDLSDPYWDHRCTWGGVRLARPLALLGPERARALAVNVAVPFLAARGGRDALPSAVLDHLPRETANRLVRQTALNLFGPHHPGSLYRTGLRRQGLLQIFHDYCLNDRSRCATCAFPGLLEDWKTQGG